MITFNVLRSQKLSLELGSAQDALICQVIAWHHFLSAINETVKNDSTFNSALRLWENHKYKDTKKKLSVSLVSNLTNIPREAKNKEKIYEYVNYLLTNEYIPHVGLSYVKKGLYTGYLVLKLIECSLGKKECDDRDSYLNKRIDTTGALLGALLRQYYTKMMKEL